jgi:C4-dicarboxylate-specific signal transduction histidine kinase
METQLLRQELALFSRIATINELAASIAHEINQPLAAVLRRLTAKPHEKCAAVTVRVAARSKSWR